MNYSDVTALWYRSLRKQFTHSQVRVLMYSCPDEQLESLKAEYEGADLKVELGDER